MRHTLDGNFEIPTMDTLDSSGDVLYPGLHIFRSSRLFSKDTMGATASGRNSTSSSVRGNKASSVSGHSDSDSSDVEHGSDRSSYVSSISYTASGPSSKRSSRINSVASTNSIVNNPIQAAMSPSSGGIIGRPLSQASSAGASSYQTRSIMATHVNKNTNATSNGSQRGNTGDGGNSDPSGDGDGTAGDGQVVEV